MDLGAEFRRISRVLEAAETPYMLTGSFASSYYEALRATQDIDIVIAPTPEQLRQLIHHLQSQNYHVDAELALPAYRDQSMFNVFDNETGWKIDFIFRKSRAFSHEEFSRRRATTFQGAPLFVATAEDVMVSKLEWAKMGESARQIEDVAAVLKKQRATFDCDYVEKWVKELGLSSEWTKAKSLAGLE